MDLSIIVVSWNTKDFTLRAIDSIAKSRSKLKYEIIVVDNASSDDSVSAIRKLQTSNYELRIITNKENLGFSKANNIGIKQAKGKYILLLNSDTEVKKGSIDKLLDFAKKNANAGIVVPKLLNSDGTTQGSVFRQPSVFRAIRQYWFGGEKLLDKYSPRSASQGAEQAVAVEAAVMAAFLITPSAFKKVGLLDERYFMYFEDLDYCRRVKASGLKIYFVPEARVVHYHGASGAKLVQNKDQWKRLIPGSIIYHGFLKHYLITGIIWLSQKFGRLLLPALVALLAIPAFYQLLKPGYFLMQDDLQAFRVNQMDRCFDDRQIPCRWVPDAGYQYGYPQFNYYPPFPYYLGAALHRLGIQYIDSVKILFILGYILSALSMYVLVKSLLGKFPGFIAALMYTYIPYKAVEVYVRGALSEFWAQIFFPIILWAIYRLVESGKTKYLIRLGVSISMLTTTHLLMTIIFIPVAGVWALYWLFRYRFQHIKKLVFSGLLGFGLSAFFVLPVLLERRFAHLESLLGGYFDYRAHFVSLQKLFLSMEWGYGSSGFPNEKLNLSLGIPHLIAGFVAAPALAILTYRKYKRFSMLFWILGVLELGVLFMIHMKSSFIWAVLPSLWYLQFPWRFLAVAIFLICMLIALGLKFAGKYKYIFGFILISSSFLLYIGFYVPKDWLNITDREKFSGNLWEKQLTISIFDYLPIYANLPPNRKAPDLPEILDGQADFVNYKKGSDYQEGRIEVSKDATIRLPLFDFPGMKVWVDGETVVHRNDDCRGEPYCFGLISFDIPKGEHYIEARLTNTFSRSAGNWITLGSIVAVGVLLVRHSLGKGGVVQSKKDAKIFK